MQHPLPVLSSLLTVPLAAAREADRKCWNHSSFSLPVRPNRYRVTGSWWSVTVGLSALSPSSCPSTTLSSPTSPSARVMLMGYFLFHTLLRAKPGGNRDTWDKNSQRGMTKETFYFILFFLSPRDAGRQILSWQLAIAKVLSTLIRLCVRVILLLYWKLYCSRPQYVNGTVAGSILFRALSLQS